MKVAGHSCQAGSDDPANIISAAVDDIKRHRRPEIDDDGRRAEMLFGGDRIGQPISADRLRTRIGYSDARDGLRVENQRFDAPTPLQKRHRGPSRPGNDARDGRSFDGLAANERANRLASLAENEFAGGNIRVLEDALFIGESHMRVRIADIEKENHILSSPLCRPAKASATAGGEGSG